MKYVLKVDGTCYPNIGISGMTRTARVADDNTSAWTLAGTYRRGIVGTYYDYSFLLYNMAADGAVYDALYEVLSAPVASHEIELPYGQGSKIITAYIEVITDIVRRPTLATDNPWWGEMNVLCMATEPNRLPN